MKSLWLHKNKPELKTKRISEGKILKESGNPVLDLFFKKYSGGSECGRNQIEEEKDWPLAIDLTKQAIKDGVKILYNPAFFANDLLVDIHLLQKNDDGSYTAFVLKIATRISDRSLQAAAYQLFAIENSGIIISEFKFVIINNHYRLRGELNPSKLFREVSVTQKLRLLLPETITLAEKMTKVLYSKKEPQIKIGPHCTEPHTCEFQERCWGKVPSDSIFELVGFPKHSMFNFWNQGLRSIGKIPDSTTLSFNQEIQRKKIKRLDKKSLKHFFNEIKYPLFLVDFEGFLPAVPQLQGGKPFEMIPFLFSGFYIAAPHAEPIHKFHLCEPTENILSEFALKLIEAADSAQSILCYDTLTEKNVLKMLLKRLPELETTLKDLMEKMIDLSNPIKRKDFYLPEMKGHVSLKYVLPAIDSDFGYESLEIQTGRMAANTYQVIYDNMNNVEVEKHKENLIAYCRHDAIGLLKLYQSLLEEIS